MISRNTKKYKKARSIRSSSDSPPLPAIHTYPPLFVSSLLSGFLYLNSKKMNVIFLLLYKK